MYILRSHSKTKEMIEIEDRLKNHSLAYKVELDDNLEILSLKDNDLSILGFTAIVKHLDELSGELNQWYYCDC